MVYRRQTLGSPYFYFLFLQMVYAIWYTYWAYGSVYTHRRSKSIANNGMLFTLWHSGRKLFPMTSLRGFALTDKCCNIMYSNHTSLTYTLFFCNKMLNNLAGGSSFHSTLSLLGITDFGVCKPVCLLNCFTWSLTLVLSLSFTISSHPLEICSNNYYFLHKNKVHLACILIKTVQQCPVFSFFFKM